MKYFRNYLYGHEFTARTDHGSLRWLANFKDPEGQLARWLETLSSYSMKIEHRPGRLHRNADGLSRIPCKQCGRREIDTDPKHTMNLNLVNLKDDSNMTSLKDIQEKDAEISLVRSWVESGEKPDYKEISSRSYFVKSLWSQWSRLQIINDLLVRHWDVLGTEIVYWQAIVPLGHQRAILKYAHDIKASGHLGINKTMSKIRQRYYWPGLQNDIKSYIAGCEKCSKRKESIRTKEAPMQIVRSGYPFERIAIDILGKFPITEKGNKYILVIGDYFTKWTECFPVPNMEAVTVAKILVNEVIARFGIPNQIHSDQGKKFESKLFKELCQLLQIDKTRTTPYHPQSDGMVERFNRTLVTMLSNFVNDHH